MNMPYIKYYSKQKRWWANMDGIVINYRHRGETNDMYLVHMTLPKERIDRIGYGQCWCRFLRR